MRVSLWFSFAVSQLAKRATKASEWRAGSTVFSTLALKKADTKVRLSRRYLVLMLRGADQEDIPGPPAKLRVVSVFHFGPIAKTIAVSINSF